jgi:hypothetical protein
MYVSEVGGSMKDELYYYRVVRTEKGWERPLWLKEEDIVKAEELAERLTKIVEEFNENNKKFKATVSIRYCKPTVCEDKRVFYDITLKDMESGEEVATITFEWNMTDGLKSLVYVIAGEYVTRLEDTLNILYLAGKLAAEFFKD